MAVKLIGVNGKMLEKPEQYRIYGHHFNGTDYENLIEYAGRKCYDSINTEKSRSSKEFHEHILEVNHDSVTAHSMLFVKINSFMHFNIFKIAFANERGWWTDKNSNNEEILCVNFRFLNRYKNVFSQHTHLLDQLILIASEKAPFIFQKPNRVIVHYYKEAEESEIPEELKWYSFEINNISRALSIELNRHMNQTALSQQSSRYVDKSNFKFIKHPHDAMSESDTEDFVELCKGFYEAAFTTSYNKLIASGVEKFTAKKQARGVASRYLPQGSDTEKVFSVSKWQLDQIIKQRLNPAADKEIYNLAEEMKNVVDNYNKKD